jgi:hypothetical protein
MKARVIRGLFHFDHGQFMSALAIFHPPAKAATPRA